MKRKYLLYGTLLSSLSLNIYLMNTEVVVSDNLTEDDMVEDELILAQSAIKKPSIQKSKNLNKAAQDIKGKILNTVPANVVEDDEAPEDFSDADYEKQYQESKNKWQEDMRSHLERDLGIDPDYVDQYFSMAMDRDREISQIMQSHFDDSTNEKEPYVFTVEDNIQLAKINSKYLSKLKKIFGEEAYEDYVEYRNQSVRKMIESGSGFMVEF